GPVIRLQPLDGEGELIQNLLQEPQRIGSRPTWEERDQVIAGTIIDGSVLVQTRRDFDGIHLNACSWPLARIATRLFWPSMATEGRYMLTAEHLLDGGRRKHAPLHALYFVLNPTGSQIPLLAEFKNPLLLLLEDFPARGYMQAMTFGNQPCCSLLFIA